MKPPYNEKPPMSAAAKMQMLEKLIRRGLLCTCNKTEVVTTHSELGDHDEEKIVHSPDCEANKYFIELLAGE